MATQAAAMLQRLLKAGPALTDVIAGRDAHCAENQIGATQWRFDTIHAHDPNERCA